MRLASARAALSSSVTISPGSGATNVGLDAPVVVATNAGYVRGVRVVATTGARITGALAPSWTSWWSNTALAPGTTYQVSARVVDSDGVTAATVSSTFQTVVPGVTVQARVFPSEGMTVGVGQPIVVRFDHAITDDAARTSVVRHFTLEGTQRVPGGWHWFSAYELHFRPAALWPAGEQVTLTSNLDGWNAGGGIWGSGSQRVHFTIGDAHVAIANLATHVMTVSTNGHTIATYPFSGGRDQYPTMNGTHLVMDRQYAVHMVSSSNGIPVNSPDGYDETVYYDVHISDSGEYVHAAPWSVSSQGRTNVSHGCINLSDANATTFYNYSGVGDIVVVTGGPRAPELGDHGVMDWDTPSDQWTAAVVRSTARPATAHATAVGAVHAR
ncbi:MAG: ErfK/YbiS/YcfS/YnhG family protein [Actinomycetia bacterium]|nr:ErfK/YbiS/YcfS/YnhG family protein [Actinomycetes bacterium]